MQSRLSDTQGGGGGGAAIHLNTPISCSRSRRVVVHDVSLCGNAATLEGTTATAIASQRRLSYARNDLLDRLFEVEYST